MRISSNGVRDIFVSAGVLLNGHFVLASGKHSSQYLDKFRVYEHPKLTERLCAGIVERVTEPVDTVAGPGMGGFFLAHEVGRQMNIRALYAEREETSPGRTFRRGMTPAVGERVLVVDDLLSTTGSLRETIEAVRRAGATIVSAIVLVDRSGVRQATPVTALWTTRLDVYDAASCPLCRDGVQIHNPVTSAASMAKSTDGGLR